MRIARIPATAGLSLCLLASSTDPDADAQTRRSDDRGVLKVPFVTQQQDRCAAAAPAMVLRYWGRTDATPDHFTTLLTCTARGLEPDALATALHARGWRTDVRRNQASTIDQLRDEVRRGYPVIALVGDRPGLNHYVVVIGTTSDEVVVQDPLRGPYEVLETADFDAAWSSRGRWMLVATPSTNAKPPDPPAMPSTAVAESLSSCADLIGSAAERGKRDRPAAERALRAATRLCSDDSVAWRELAAIRFADSRWKAAEHDAHRAVDLEPEDRRAWDLLARSRYYSGEVRAALRSWNEIGQPIATSVEIHNSRHTDPQIVEDLVGIKPGDLLTNDKFIRAANRLRQLPVSFDTRLKYSVEKDGTAKVDVYLEERDVLPAGPLPITIVGVGGVVFQDVRFDIAGPSGHAENFSFSWGWERDWRHLRVGLDVPAPGKLPGIASIDAFWENQTFAPVPSAQVSAERRHVGVQFSNWAKSWLWWQTGAAWDQFNGSNYGALTAALEGRLVRDHVAVNTEAGSWFSRAGTPPGFTTAAVWMSTRSTTRSDRRIWLTVFGSAWTDDRAPYQLWAGAGSSEAGNAFLRAHPLISRGIVRGEVFGRRVEFGSVEFNRPVYKSSAGPIALALFVDAAQAHRRAEGLPDSPLFIDAGVGFRLRPPAVSGVLRLDIARGLTDGQMRVSIGMLQQWPKR